MKLCDLTKSGLAAWPPEWTHGAFRGTGPLVTDPDMNGVLIDVSADPARPGLAVPVDDLTRSEPPRFKAKGVDVVVLLDGRQDSVRGILEWDGPPNAPTPDQVATVLMSRRGSRIGDLAGLEIGESP